MEKFNDDDGVWRTIRGRKVFIQDGESVESAMSRSGKFKTMSRVQKNKDKYDTIAKFKKRKETNKLKDEKTEYKVSKDGNSYELSEEDRKKVMRKLNQDGDKLKDFNVSDDGRKYTMKPEERDKIFKKLGLENYKNEEDTNENVAEEFAKLRRNKLIKYTQENREQINKWVNEKDTTDKIGEKILNHEGLTLKEYYKYLGRGPKTGDIIIAGGKNGEDVRVGKNGKLEIINNFKKRKKSNK